MLTNFLNYPTGVYPILSSKLSNLFNFKKKICILLLYQIESCPKGTDYPPLMYLPNFSIILAGQPICFRSAHCLSEIKFSPISRIFLSQSCYTLKCSFIFSFVLSHNLVSFCSHSLRRVPSCTAADPQIFFFLN